jgi:uncharacterized protein involved in response to NO
MPAKPVEIQLSQPAAARSVEEPVVPRYPGPAVLSYGFRPFFLSAALFAGLAVPAWVFIFAGGSASDFLYAPGEWHIHEMLFGFLSAVMAGFLLTAIPNWTGRLPLRGMPLAFLWGLWLAGRVAVGLAWSGLLAAAVVDGAFLVIVAGIVWREIAAAQAWDRSPIGVLISLYAGTNVLFHMQALRGMATDLPVRLALAILMLLLTVIGGRLTPMFTREYLEQRQTIALPPPMSRFDGIAIVLVLVAAFVWVAQPESLAAGWLLLAAGAVNVVRLMRWRGWMTWREPLVVILNVGYAWLALSMLAIGAAILGAGLPPANAIHVLTSGAVGAMTLAVMTRASLGHTGRPKQVGSATVAIFVLANLGALLRIVTPASDAPTAATHLVLALAAAGWSGAYLLFAAIYAPILLRPALDE